MKTKLDRLLESIDPSITLDQVSSRIDQALNSFQIDSGIIEDWEVYKDLFTNFFRHTENNILRIKSFKSANPKIEWGRCIRLLLKEYGPNGEKTAFEMVRTGNQGGLYKVLKSLSKQMIEEYAGTEIRAKIGYFWHSLSVDEKWAATDEYLTKYGHLLPSELTEGSAARIKADFTKVLEEHPRIIKRMRIVGRN
ncbi:MAG: hypothetical protein HF978_06335 [Desulfobacteraceae bacterium]|nr:hypothetical protein [Desulfobacteraceae bacterium]MBC2755148.1 hypothetical protein [Desulfobacteraceae bacterium]